VFRAIEGPVGPIKYRDEDSAVWRVRDDDITAKAPNEVFPPSLPLVLGERTLQVRHRQTARCEHVTVRTLSGVEVVRRGRGLLA
jgi:hypothetical protein